MEKFQRNLRNIFPAMHHETREQMPINRIKIVPVGLIVIALLATIFILPGEAQADDHRKFNSWFERLERDRSFIFDKHDKGNETAGQIAAWLLVAANLPVVLSVFIKWTNRFAPNVINLRHIKTS